eukprot:GEMP01055485.1.p1 GENE.GEMP01055485.1~~GEMP01055485.1.p1  ORF type:complete len:234 (+),score=42.78 GEMP01055485.1:50-703(+)
MDGPEVHFIGEIDYGANFRTTDGLFVDYRITSGDAWWSLSAGTSDQTQTAYPDYCEQNVWCHPLDLHFAATSLAQWPRLQIQVLRLDDFGRIEPVSYGVLCLPNTVGHHEMKCRTWSVKGSTYDEVTAHFVGSKPQLVDPLAVIDARLSLNPERAGLLTEPSGTVHVSLDVILRNFDLDGDMRDTKTGGTWTVGARKMPELATSSTGNARTSLHTVT